MQGGLVLFCIGLLDREVRQTPSNRELSSQGAWLQYDIHSERMKIVFD